MAVHASNLFTTFLSHVRFYHRQSISHQFKPPIMPPIIHCVRHAEGWHNLSEDNEKTTHDASLTPMGRQQALRLSERFPNMDRLDMAVTSPLRRTIQTAYLCFNDHLESKGLKLFMLPQAQETSSKEADTGTQLWKLQREFGQKRLDTTMIESEN